MATRKPTYRNADGQALVEIALSIPFLLLCLVAIMYFGRAYYIVQTCTFAAQEGAKVAARLPNLSDPNTREYVRGFTAGGAGSNPKSVIYNILGGATMLSNGRTGDLPPQASVKILPWDATDANDVSPSGTITVVVTYPFSLLVNPFTGRPSGETTQVNIAMAADDTNPVQFGDFSIRQTATVSPQVYQEGM
jgi:Flp pilus assembly protein TadG